MAERAAKTVGKTFFSGVLLLTLSTVSVKVIGLLYKIPMLAYLGAEGMGYFHSAYEVYALFCVIATAGLPVALSVLISSAIAKGERNRVTGIYRTSLLLFLGIGILGSLVMLLLARRFCGWIKSDGAYACMLTIAPTVLLGCIASALRGYFQGHQCMLPTALSQLLEALGKLIFGLLLARYALYSGYDTPTVAAFAGLGLTLGMLLSVLYLALEKLRFDRAGKVERIEADAHPRVRTGEESYRILRDLGRLSVPMTLGASLVSLTKLVDMTMILRRLQAIGFTEVMANEAYGSYTTLALSVYALLPSLINSIALPLVPMLSAAIAAGNLERQEQMVGISYRLTVFLAMPASLSLAVYAEPILRLLFSGEETAVAISAPLLSGLGASVLLSCMITATNSVLHASQRVNRPILSMLAGALLKILTSYLLIGLPTVALAGAPISTFVCNAAVLLLNFHFAASLCRAPSPVPLFGRPLLASALSVGVSYGAYTLLLRSFPPSALLTLAALAITAVCYLLFSCRLGVLEREDALSLPMGERLWRMLGRAHLLRREDREAVLRKESKK